jgi:YHS domain-containing protein/phenylpyruvate tautomerase PptA (4-oxalocrotonate tautomerase family)
MRFVEVFVPKGVLTEDQVGRLAQRLTLHGLYADDAEGGGTISADPGVLEFLEDITHVVVHELDTWVVGGRRLRPGGPPRFVVRVLVPGPWRKELSQHLITEITRVLAEFDPEPDRLYRQPHAEVYVLGVPEGGYGAFGQVVGESAMAEMISAARRGEGDAPPGMAVDPVCGATVALDGSDAVTAVVDGTTYGFCCNGCRRHFLTRREAVVP